MRLICRPLAPGETDHEQLWLALSIGSVLLLAAWLTLHLPWPVCVFHALTGHPCPTCGATRAAIALLHGDVGTAWHWNPLAFVVYCALALGNVYLLIAIATGAPRLRVAQITSTEVKFLRGLAVVLVLANWLYLLSANPPV